MKLQITGCNEVVTKKGVKFTVVYGINLKPISNGYGCRPYSSTKNDKTTTQLWIPERMNITASKELVNKVLNVDFNENGYLDSVELIK